MTSIDFRAIRSAPKSRNDSFEALAVQLFRGTCKAPSSSTFISLRGDGGDGGVEAYFRTPTGSVFGVQAKYFFQLTDAELSQINKSLETAVGNHPALSEYWVYIPFDLTGRVAKGERGLSQAERFEAWKKRVEDEAAARGAPLTVKLCTAAVIASQLLALDPHGGLRRYWFDESVLSERQIRDCMNAAIAFAGPRYTGSLDVVTNVNSGLDFFGGIGDFQAWQEDSFLPIVREIRSSRRWLSDSLDILGETDADKTRGLIQQLLEACLAMREAEAMANTAAVATAVLAKLFPNLEAVCKAQEEAFFKQHGQESDTPGFRQFHAEFNADFPAGKLDAAREFLDAAKRLQGVLTSPEVSAASTQSLLLLRPAGIGKTHAIVAAALRRLDRNAYSLVVFGDDFDTGEPWEVLRSKLGFGASVSRDSMFGSFEACAEHSGLPFVIYIDALNEGARASRWKDKLPELLSQCKAFPRVKVCVSARDTYRSLVVDARFPGYAFEHVGFAGREFEAIQAFADAYSLNAEITPLFAPELTSPLFLHLACKTLRDNGNSALDVSLAGFPGLLNGHLVHCDELVRRRLGYRNPKNVVRTAMLTLADALVSSQPQDRTWEACVDRLVGPIGPTVSPEQLLAELEKEGLVIVTEAPGDTWLVRLGYQLFGDILRAASLVESNTGPGGCDVSALSASLATLSAEDEGLLEALAAVLPEVAALEITEPALGLASAHAHKLFVKALPMRSRASLTHATSVAMAGALSTPGLWPQVYEVAFRLSLVPDHKFNARRYLGRLLSRQRLADRDAYLSVAALESFDKTGAVWSLVNSSLKADLSRWPAESCRLASVVLAWLCSCTDRRIRDRATKGLLRVLASQPGLSAMLIEDFTPCDDDYIIESIALATYGACLQERDRRSEFIPALEGLLQPAICAPNILVRDTVRLLGEVLKTEGLSASLLSRLEAYPQRTELPATWPNLEDAKPLLELPHLPGNMRLWGQPLLPDFWRYQVESEVGAFDLASAGISKENIAAWLMCEALRLGYPGSNQVALKHDLVLARQFGTGRNRKGYADRLGKKYYWIGLHRLIAILADNVKPKKGWRFDAEPGPGHIWSLSLRKSDPTDARDIRPEPSYPDELIAGPRFPFPGIDGDMKPWVQADDLTPHANCLLRMDSHDDAWVALAFSAKDSDDDDRDSDSRGPYLSVDLSYASVMMPATMSPSQRTLHHAFDSEAATCYTGYFAEYPDSPAFDQLAKEARFEAAGESVLHCEVELSRGNEWEYDYSHVTAERPVKLSVPCREVVQDLKLHWDGQRGWLDAAGRLVAFEAQARRREGLLVRKDELDNFLRASGRRLLVRRFLMRGLFSDDDDDRAQIDRFDWLVYDTKKGFIVLKSEVSPYNC